jgi:hypothetical protein
MAVDATTPTQRRGGQPDGLQQGATPPRAISAVSPRKITRLDEKAADRLRAVRVQHCLNQGLDDQQLQEAPLRAHAETRDIGRDRDKALRGLAQPGLEPDRHHSQALR